MFGYNSTLGFLLSLGIFTSDPSKLIGETEWGKLEGKTSFGRDDRTIYEFVGIPYAQPPVGDLRFRAPVEWNTSWEGVRDATSYGSKCKQFHLIGKFISGNEDCLYLNVYTHQFKREDEPPMNEEDLRPVIVYFHGGLFMHGSGEWYKPKYMLDADIVLVTVNYRLGILGFLNLEAEDIRGNQGLKDQVLALKWIQNNIRQFGGNPNSVTIMGESAGGACVHYHLLSPLSRGLFHRAISQSGNALVSWASQDDPREQAILLATQLGCLKSSLEKIAKCLRSLDADKIAKSQRAASDILHHRHALYAPTIELPAEDAFITERPQNIIKRGDFTKVPWLVGVNSEEGLIYSAPILRNETIRQELNKNWTKWAPSLFRFSQEPDKLEIATKIREYYLGNSYVQISMDTLHNITTFLSDRSFFEGLHNSLNLHRGQHPVYPYVYSHEGRFSFAKLVFSMNFVLPVVMDVVVSRTWKWFQSTVLRVPETTYGVAHGDELPLFFNLPFQSELKEKGKQFGDYDMSKFLISTWAAFAKDGVPPAINENITWPMLSPSGTSLINGVSNDGLPQPIQFMRINKTCEIVDEPFHPRAEFWRKLNLLPYKIDPTENATETSLPNKVCNDDIDDVSCKESGNVHENNFEDNLLLVENPASTS